LIKAINKTLSHMTYSRDRASQSHAHFEGRSHLHGTVKLMRQTWGDFMKSVRPQFLNPENPEDIHYWLSHHTRDWQVEFGVLEGQFERRVNELVRETEDWERRGVPVTNKWKLNHTPDGPV
jgi:hypothetical protein